MNLKGIRYCTCYHTCMEVLSASLPRTYSHSLISPWKDPSVQAIQLTFALQWPVITTVQWLPVYYGEIGVNLIFLYSLPIAWYEIILRLVECEAAFHRNVFFPLDDIMITSWLPKKNRRGFQSAYFLISSRSKGIWPPFKLRSLLLRGLPSCQETYILAFALELALEVFECCSVYVHLQPLLRGL